MSILLYYTYTACTVICILLVYYITYIYACRPLPHIIICSDSDIIIIIIIIEKGKIINNNNQCCRAQHNNNY